jgi:hypothetical protein
MNRQTRTSDTVLAMSRKMTAWDQNVVVAGGRKVKDDKKQNTLAPSRKTIHKYNLVLFVGPEKQERNWIKAQLLPPAEAGLCHQGTEPPPPPSTRGKAGKNHLNEEITPPPH